MWKSVAKSATCPECVEQAQVEALNGQPESLSTCARYATKNRAHYRDELWGFAARKDQGDVPKDRQRRTDVFARRRLEAND
jgi:hypothetical protein